MPRKRRDPRSNSGNRPPNGSRRRPPSNKTAIDVSRIAGGHGWMLVHPPCVRERSEDLEEVRKMLAAEEHDAARDELRWLLEGCSELIEAHFLLGKLAVEVDGDIPLGRGHFGIGYQLGVRARQRRGEPLPMPALHPANRFFFDAGRGLAWCLNELGKGEMAAEVVAYLLGCDPADPLRLRGWIDELQADPLPLVTLEAPPRRSEPGDAQ